MAGISSLAMRELYIKPPFSLAETCAPAVWGRGRWPNVDWIDESFVWVGWESPRIVWRRVRQVSDDCLAIDGAADRGDDRCWADAVLGTSDPLPRFDDPTLDQLADQFPGLRSFATGTIFDGLLGSLVGQSISVAAAAITEQRLASLFHPGIALSGRRFWPLPDATRLATADPALVRQSGVTWRRAYALVAVGHDEMSGRLPDRATALSRPDEARMALRACELVGPWTAESTLLWGIGEPNAYPSGDAALLRAARISYRQPTLDHQKLDRLAIAWHPHRGWAARLLWIGLLGPRHDRK